MADPVVNIIDPTTFQEQEFSTQDTSLIQNQELDNQFNTATDTVELYLYDYNQNIIYSDYNYGGWKSYQDPSLPNTGKLQDLYVDPAIDGALSGVQAGDIYVLYNFVSNRFLSSVNSQFYISEISSDRTEITLKTNNLSNEEMVALTEQFLLELNGEAFFEEFYLNFGNNDEVIGLNLRVNTTGTDYSLQVKLYEPLPTQFEIKSTTWIQIRIADPVGYRVTYDNIVQVLDDIRPLKGPNLNLQSSNEVSNSTSYESLSTLTATRLTGSRSQLASILEAKEIELNIDYTDFANFVHFSSAKKRLENFYYKVSLIEAYQNDINAITGSTAPTTQQSQSISVVQSNIDQIVQYFDDYEYYLYYESGSKTWPKTNSTAPYILASTGSTAALNWYGSDDITSTYYGGEILSGSNYDNENQDNLVYSIPEYLRDDSSNQPYETFVEMIGQHFDNLYLYTEAITSKYNADNRLDYGISKDLVADTLRSFGVKLYENNFSTDDLYTALIGLTPSGSTLPLPNISTVFPVVGEGNEYIETIISASSDVLPLDDLNKSVYKRLYHNLPALVKKKGTLDGLRLLINSFGIPDTILRISEFGGKDKKSNTWDYWQHTYNKALDTLGTTYISASWGLNTAWNATDDVPHTVALRFKTRGIPASTHYSQSLWETDNGSKLILEYTGTAYTSGSYSGSIVDPYNQYGYLKYYPDAAAPTTTASVYLPFFDGNWWTVGVNKDNGNNFLVNAGNILYNGDTGNEIGFFESGAVTYNDSAWLSATEAYFASGSTYGKIFSGSIQEVRYYASELDKTTFKDLVMNPESSETSNNLAFRASLGGELYTGSVSIHPKVSGLNSTSSFAADSNFYINTAGTFTGNKEYYFYDQPAVGIQNAVSNKIKLEDSTLYGTTLSGLASLQQNYPASSSYTRDVNYLEVGFSPQNEINEDIMDSLGYFNIGDYIGDPRQISSSTYSYPALDSLRDDYFKKYITSYNFTDYLRLIKFFDNSLFKMVKDFIPARTGAATGAIIKQNLLERNRQRPAQLTFTQPEYTASIAMETFSGGPGGVMDVYQTSNQAWTASILTKAGLVTEIHSDRSELFNGELSGSTLYPQLQYELNTTPLLNNVSASRLSDLYEDVDYTTDGYRPVNFNFITASIAFKAPVQDSNYSSGSAWTLNRYDGVKNTGEKNTSILFASTSIADGYPIDDFTDWFAYYDWIGGSDPQYLGGGNIHLLNLINAQTREVVGLSAENKNVHLVSNIFKQGQTPTRTVTTFSTVTTTQDLEIETGGALYETIFYYTESAAFYINDIIYDTGFATSSASTLSDRSGGAPDGGWLNIFTGGTLIVLSDGTIIEPSATLNIFNKATGQYVNADSTAVGVRLKDTYLPLQSGDFIRFGSGSSTSLSYIDSETGGIGLHRIRTINNLDTYPRTQIEIYPSLNSVETGSGLFDSYTTIVPTGQQARVYRRVPNETFVVIKELPTETGAGLLIPSNFNPAHDAIEIARRLGILA